MIRKLLIGVTLGAVVSLGVVTPAHAAPAPTANVLQDAWESAVYVTSELLSGTYGATQGDPAEAFNSAATKGRRGAQGASSHNGKSGAKSIPLGVAGHVGKGVQNLDLITSTYRIGTGLSNWGMKFFGVDNVGNVCSRTSGERMDPWSEMARTLTGTDCHEFEQAEGYVPDSDIESSNLLDGYFSDTYYVGGSSDSVNRWYGQILNSPEGRTGSFQVEIRELGFYGPHVSESGLNYRCKNPATNEFKTVSPGTDWLVGGRDLGQVRHFVFECGVGFELYSMGLNYPTKQSASFNWWAPSGDHWIRDLGVEYPAYLTKLSPDRPVSEVAGDVERVLECTTTYTDGTIVKGVSEPFKETDGTFGEPVCPPAAAAPGATPKVVDKVVVKDQKTGNTVHNQTTAPAYKTAAATDPECMDGSCVLNLKVKATGKSCFDLKDTCRDWIDNKADYSCSYGAKAKPIESCFVYGNTFDRAKVAVGNPYADPATGEDTHSVTGPSLDGEGMSRDVRPNQAGRDCFGDGWATVANPLDWVMVPVNCSLEWAFVPNEIVLQEAAFNTADAWGETAPGKMAAFVAGLAAVAPHLDGCEGPRVHFTIDFRGFAPWAFLEVDSYPMSACAPPWDFVAGAARVIGGLFMCYAAFRASSRYLGGIIGFAEFGKGA